ncbi:MAG: NAD(P)/FAD-dependent oxidoreductase [Methyloligellaceae bacterium]
MSKSSDTNGAEFDIVIVGGGLQGCSAALQLAARGKRVAVIERDAPGRHASGLNAGGVRSLGRHPAEIPLALASLELWRDLERLVGSDCGYRARGQLKIAETEADMGKLEARAAETRALGFDHEGPIGRNALCDLVPEVAPGCVGGLYEPDEGAADPVRTTSAFFERARDRGVTFVVGEAVTDLDHTGDRWRIATPERHLQAEVLVNCAGAWGAKIAALTGDEIPLEAVALMMLVMAPVKRFLEPVCGVAGRKLSCKQLANGTVLVGGGHKGTIDGSAHVAWPVPAELEISAATVRDVFPLLSEVPVAWSWAGIEGITPDGLPVLGPSSEAPSVFHAFGFSAHGFALGPIVGQILTELVVDGGTRLPIEPFAPGRFPRREAA